MAGRVRDIDLMIESAWRAGVHQARETCIVVGRRDAVEAFDDSEGGTNFGSRCHMTRTGCRAAPPKANCPGQRPDSGGGSSELGPAFLRGPDTCSVPSRLNPPTDSRHFL